ncbi:MAG: hypothetical protein IPP91_18030 [Betaproteobacteria bacterium]|nr:hypothetical protein [Betaproteobacteria bacterium]
MTQDASAAYPLDLDRVLAAKSIRDAGSRALFLAAVRELGKDTPPFTADRLDRLTRVEEQFEALLLYDQFEFLRGPASVAEAERDFAHTVQRICLEIANGFQRFLRHRDDWATTPESAEMKFRVTGLAMNAIHCFVKWGCFLGEPGRSVPWKQLHALYALAESGGYSQVPFVLHPSQPSFRPSVQSLFLRTLILDLVNAGNLSRVQLEIADGWFSSWCGDYSLDTDYSSRSHLFYVDLATDRGLHLMRNDSHGDTVRYVRTDGLNAQLEEVQAGLRHGKLYAGHGAGAVFPVEEHVALLAVMEKLYQSMIASAENRIEERTRFEDREIEVVAGMERVLAKIRRGPEPAQAGTASQGVTVTSEMVEITPSGLSLTSIETAPAAAVAVDPDIQTWRVKDLSSKGYGLLVDKASADTVMLNGVIGLRNQLSGGWILGSVVRKLANRVRGEILAGVEVLSFRPLLIELSPAEGGAAIEALYLPGTEASGRLDSIMIRATDFSATTPYRLEAGGATYRIRLNRIAKKGADWIRARFEIEAKT